MKTFDNEITIQLGESFTIDKIIQNKDGSPFIISSKLQNPYFLVTVSSSKYAQSNRYVKNYWLDLSTYLKFLSTQPVDLHSIKTSADGIEAKYGDWETLGNSLPSGYIDGMYVQFDSPSDAVFYFDSPNGIREYKYFDSSADEQTGVKGWTTYNCRIIKQFSSEDTSEWVGQNYVYSIRLVSGVSTVEYLRELCIQNNIEYDVLDDAQTLLSKLPQEFANIDVTRPIAKADLTIPILKPTSLSVLSNIRGGF